MGLNLKRFIAVLLLVTLLGTVLPQQKPLTENGISVFGFIEKISGKRNFDITVKLIFDVISDEKRKLFSTYFEMKIVNLEEFTFTIKEPEILKDIVIKYNVLTKKAEYSYLKYKVTETFKAELPQISDLIQSLTDFLSSPLFESKNVKDGIEFRPRNFQVLARFGVQPIVVLLKMKDNVPQSIEIRNDKTDEKITLIFEKFVARREQL